MFFTLKKVSLVLIVASFLFASSPMAQAVSKMPSEPVLDHAWRQYEYPPDFFAAEESTNPRIFQEVDILHYTIDAKFFLGASYPDTAYLEAVTTIDGQAKAETLNELIIDFYDNITINSLKFNDIEFSNYVRSDNKIWMDLSGDPLDPSEFFEVTVEYTHVYGSAYQGLMFRTQGDEGDTPAICSIDQPYRSPGWWPCFDYPSDKATADIYMTYPDWMTAVSNGLLQSEENNGDGTKTSHYREDYQAYTSALSVAMTDYVAWTDTYVSPLDGTTMPLEYYAFPADAAKAMIDYDVTGDAIVYFAQIYGEYPFINEKYGIAETPNRMGSLEHQTMTSLTYRATQSDVNWDVIVHELAHQWWGDWVTCETWNHVWLHEGFATYSEVLFHEYDTGEPAGPFMAVNYDDGEYGGDLGGTVYCEDHHLHNPFTETGSIYEKGGWVLHMLRNIIGNDTTFFDAIKTFGINHAHSTAVTDDLIGVMEVAYGDSLDDFFNQWLYTPYRPIYSVTYETSSREGGYKVDVNLRQTQAHSVQDIETNPLREHYIMPVEFTVHYTDETSDTFSFDNTQRDQSFQILTTKEPEYTVFDEGVHILKIAEEQVADNDGVPGDGDNSGIPGDNFCNGTTENCDDNCPDVQNGPEGGTCTAGATYKIGRPCLNDGDCEVGGFCSMNQEDTYPSGGDGIGDVCFLCESNFDCDGDVDGTDAAKFKLDFGRSTFFNPCTNVEQCNGDFDCDSDCDGTDAAKFKEDFGRSGFSNPCPACIEGDWCSYP